METPCSSSDAQPPSGPDLPFVYLNLAISADGKIATANRTVTSLGSESDHAHLLELRSHADAVMAGARTVDSEEINMGPGPAKFRRQRIERGLQEYNLRVVVSGSGSLSPDAALFKKRFSPILILTTEAAGPERLRRLREVADAVKVCGPSAIDFTSALQWLRREWSVSTLLCEGGGALNSALLKEQLVHEVHLTFCPFVVGGVDAPTLADGPIAATLSEAVPLELRSFHQVASELFAVYRVAPDQSQ